MDSEDSRFRCRNWATSMMWLRPFYFWLRPPPDYVTGETIHVNGGMYMI